MIKGYAVQYRIKDRNAEWEYDTTLVDLDKPKRINVGIVMYASEKEAEEMTPKFRAVYESRVVPVVLMERKNDQP